MLRPRATGLGCGVAGQGGSTRRRCRTFPRSLTWCGSTCFRLVRRCRTFPLQVIANLRIIKIKGARNFE